MITKIIIDSTDGEFQIKTPLIDAKSFTGVERKLKGENIVAIVKIDDEKFMVFVEE